MYISRSQFKRIRHLLPKPRGSRRISHYRLLNALAYMAVTAVNGAHCQLDLAHGIRFTCVCTDGRTAASWWKYFHIYSRTDLASGVSKR